MSKLARIGWWTGGPADVFTTEIDTLPCCEQDTFCFIIIWCCLKSDYKSVPKHYNICIAMSKLARIGGGQVAWQVYMQVKLTLHLAGSRSPYV